MTDKHSKPSPNDQRSDSKNPNNPAHQAGQDDRSRRMNPQDPHYEAPPPAPAKPPAPVNKP